MAAISKTRQSSAFDDAIVREFQRFVHDRPEAPIVLSSSSQCSFASLAALADQLSTRLAGDLPARPALVALAAANGPAFLAGFVALRRAGYAVLLVDAQAPAAARRAIAATLGATAALECARPWPDTAADFTVVPHDVGDAAVLPADIAVVKVTSGTSGAPRGVAASAASVLADEAALAASMGFRDDDRLLAALPMSHSYGFSTLALSALVRGLPLIVPDGASPFDPLVAAARGRATILPTVPAVAQALLAMSVPPAWPPSVRLVISAGATLPPAVAGQFRRTYGQPIHTFYGSSECGGICYDRVGDAAEHGSVGTPVEGVTLSFTPHDGAPDGVGLVTVRSAAVCDGYLPAPDRRLADGRFETADLGHLRDGALVIVGRASRTIHVRGLKVDPMEVEHVVRACDGVADVVVTGVGAPGSEQIVCAVVAGAAAGLSYATISAWCRARLADHKVPRSILVVDRIVYSARGKVDPEWLAAIRDAQRAR